MSKKGLHCILVSLKQFEEIEIQDSQNFLYLSDIKYFSALLQIAKFFFCLSFFELYDVLHHIHPLVLLFYIHCINALSFLLIQRPYRGKYFGKTKALVLLKVQRKT